MLASCLSVDEYAQQTNGLLIDRLRDVEEDAEMEKRSRFS